MVLRMLQKWFRTVHYSQLTDGFVKFNYILIFLCAGYFCYSQLVLKSPNIMWIHLSLLRVSAPFLHILIIYFSGIHIKDCSMFLRTYSLNLYNASISANFPCVDVYSKLNGSSTLLALECECG